MTQDIHLATEAIVESLAPTVQKYLSVLKVNGNLYEAQIFHDQWLEIGQMCEALADPSSPNEDFLAVAYECADLMQGLMESLGANAEIAIRDWSEKRA